MCVCAGVAVARNTVHLVVVCVRARACFAFARDTVCTLSCSVVLAFKSGDKLRVCACESEREADWKWGELLKKLGREGAVTTILVDCGDGGAQSVTDPNSLWAFLDRYGTFKGPVLRAALV